MITVRNPHSVLLALKLRTEAVKSLFLPESGLSPAWEEVKKEAERRGVAIGGAKPSTLPIPRARVQDFNPRNRGRGKSHPPKPEPIRLEGGRTGAAEAQIEEKPMLSVEELFENATTRAEGKGIWLALDSLQDPQNVGAIFRSAAFFGVQGILLTEERSSPLTSVVYDISCGGVEAVPHAGVINLQRAFEKAKEAGLWILGTSEHAETNLSSVKPDRPWLVVVGNEEKGLRKLTLERCDQVCKVQPRGEVGSLNVSVATAVLLHSLIG